MEKKINVGTPICFTGKIGGVDYQSKVTSYGRLRISKILDADMDKIGILKDPYERISAKAATKLSMYLNQFPENGVEAAGEGGLAFPGGGTVAVGAETGQLLDDAQFLDVPGDGGLGADEACFLQQGKQLLLGLYIGIGDDLHDLGLTFGFQ